MVIFNKDFVGRLEIIWHETKIWMQQIRLNLEVERTKILAWEYTPTSCKDIKGLTFGVKSQVFYGLSCLTFFLQNSGISN